VSFAAKVGVSNATEKKTNAFYIWKSQNNKCVHVRAVREQQGPGRARARAGRVSSLTHFQLGLVPRRLRPLSCCASAELVAQAAWHASWGRAGAPASRRRAKLRSTGSKWGRAIFARPAPRTACELLHALRARSVWHMGPASGPCKRASCRSAPQEAQVSSGPSVFLDTLPRARTHRLSCCTRAARALLAACGPVALRATARRSCAPSTDSHDVFHRPTNPLTLYPLLHRPQVLRDLLLPAPAVGC
jgi:hypothetical protein